MAQEDKDARKAAEEMYGKTDNTWPITEFPKESQRVAFIKGAEWKDNHPSKELINKICQLFMEHEAIEKYNSEAINWIYEQF